MLDRERARAAATIVRDSLDLELNSDAGRINYRGMALAFLLVVFVGVPSVLEATLARLLPWGSDYDFPWLSVLAIFVGGIVACVLILAVMRALLEPR